VPTPRPPVGGSEASPSERIGLQQLQVGAAAGLSCEEIAMAFVRVEQRNAHLAGLVRLDTVNGRDGKLARDSFIAISCNSPDCRPRSA